MDPAALEAAKRLETLPPIRVRILGDVADLTLDEDTEFAKQVLLEGVHGRDTILDMKKRISEQEGIAVADQRLFLAPHELRDETKLGECFVQWAGFGLDDWPPKFVVKPAIRGFEVVVEVPATRDTAIWDLKKQKLKRYGKRRLLFDLLPSTTVRQLKGLIERRLEVPAARQLLSAQMADEEFGQNLNGHKGLGYTLELDEDSRTMNDYGVDRRCIMINFRINRFDVNGDFIFEDDAYFDNEGFHPPTQPSWMPPHISTSWRPG
ncbi:unnamed protein product [Polarella glacialis]|uniref:Ubiquitin-like domain-containing protein n=1 Tax=Polarella glacialis TaxID=89957 RepID=A0A813H7Y6_POLGL|nr:unnamed protein product [Polarella glacialis]